ncbi:MAG: hypothetical protein ACPGOV_09430 [Magnetovibrionaceae bacterium]
MSEHHTSDGSHEDDPQTWFDKPGNVKKTVYAVYALCALLFVADFLYHKHVHYGAEEIPGFYGIYGFLAFTGIVLIGKQLRKVLKRDEDYYDR